ncbi:hypothetical protein EJP82_26680 [Paenibacillus anaericanus]|uniref:Uncharacterized protein n=1 Tax=Paenibacillus anaericanus TaxID=170367 RepID=A0A3S1D7G2_9BACL|nr:hypothetical protein [Paenibacillus anaericanus]RUT38702.1 hypothetical protein EJP82_26680 [Paenibacillus anaericanus]
MSKKKIKRSERTYPGLDPTISLDYPKVDIEKLRKEQPIRNNIRTTSNEIKVNDDQDKEVNDYVMDIAVFGAPLGIFKKKM